MRVLKVSKTDAAKRQLATAIQLWFYDGDPISVHTLGAASHQVIHDLGKVRGINTALRGLENIKPEYRDKIRRAVSKSENFFKHADKDPDDLLEFKPVSTEALLIDAVNSYENLTGEITPIFKAYRLRIMIDNPEAVKEEFRDEFLASITGGHISIRATSKQEFLSIVLDLIAKGQCA